LFLKILNTKNFRNLTLTYNANSGINVVYGRNGAGKSNFLDGIYFLTFAKSFKPYAEKNNISWKRNTLFASITGTFLQDEFTEDLKPAEFKIIFSRGSGTQEINELKRFEINGVGKYRSSFLYKIPVVLFAPHNINLIAGSPEIRRSELDDFLSMISHEYAEKITGYKIVVRNRNKILQNISRGTSRQSELKFWNHKLIDLGSYITGMRIFLLADFQPGLKKDARTLFSDELANLSIKYLSKLYEFEKNKSYLHSEFTQLIRELRNIFSKKISEGYPKELAAKLTLYGPHRDDFQLLAGQRDLKLFASRGQQRIATLILKMAMYNFLQDKMRNNPILLLDDIMSELDQKHQGKLENYLLDLTAQVFITTTEKSHLGSNILRRALVTDI